MRIKEFERLYCKDILERYNTRSTLFGEEANLPYDKIIEDQYGNRIPVVEKDEVEVPISDIICLTEKDFIKQYPGAKAYSLRRNYLSTIEILEGEELVSKLRKQVQEEREKYDSFGELYAEFHDFG